MARRTSKKFLLSCCTSEQQERDLIRRIQLAMAAEERAQRR
jgi:hypothetical protein